MLTIVYILIGFVVGYLIASRFLAGNGSTTLTTGGGKAKRGRDSEGESPLEVSY